MIVWYGRRPGSTAPPTAKHAPRFWRTTPVPGATSPEPKGSEQALDEGDGHPVSVDGAQVDRAARRLGHRRPPRAARRGTRARSARSRRHRRARARARPRARAGRSGSGWRGSGDDRSSSPSASSAHDALRRRRQLADLRALVREAERLDPARLERRRGRSPRARRPRRSPRRPRPRRRRPAPRSAIRRSVAPSSGGRRRPRREAAGRAGPPRMRHASAVRGATAKPPSAASIASARQASRPSRP